MENIQFNISEDRLKHLLSLEKDYKEFCEELRKELRKEKVKEVAAINLKAQEEIKRYSEHYQKAEESSQQQYASRIKQAEETYKKLGGVVENSINTKVEEKLNKFPRIIRWWYEI